MSNDHDPSRAFLHQDSQPSARVEPPSLVTVRSFRWLWVGLAAVTGVLVAIGAIVSGRVA